ncbi:hypothetical protein [Yersinia enterocolitica]
MEKTPTFTITTIITANEFDNSLSVELKTHTETNFKTHEVTQKERVFLMAANIILNDKNIFADALKRAFELTEKAIEKLNNYECEQPEHQCSEKHESPIIAIH